MKHDDDDDTQVYADTLLIVYQRGFADGKKAALAQEQALKKLARLGQEIEQQAEPVARKGFNDWWDGDYDDSENPFEKDSAAYWAWAGWQAAQRPWVGLTDEDFLDACQLAERGNYLLALQRIQTKLKERNT